MDACLVQLLLSPQDPTTPAQYRHYLTPLPEPELQCTALRYTHQSRGQCRPAKHHIHDLMVDDKIKDIALDAVMCRHALITE